MQQGGGAPEGGVQIPGPPKEEEPPVPELPPNNTIYVNNVCEKIKIPALIIELKAIFNQFGPIVEIQVFWGVFAAVLKYKLGEKKLEDAWPSVYRL